MADEVLPLCGYCEEEMPGNRYLWNEQEFCSPECSGEAETDKLRADLAAAKARIAELEADLDGAYARVSELYAGERIARARTADLEGAARRYIIATEASVWERNHVAADYAPARDALSALLTTPSSTGERRE